MPKEQVFTASQETGWSEYGGAAPVCMNVLVDGAGVIRRRPGLATYAEAPTGSVDANGIEGLYATVDGALLAVSGGGPIRRIYSVASGVASEIIPTVASEYMIGTERPTFAEHESLVAIACGSTIQKVEIPALTSRFLGGSPPEATHVVANSGRLLCNRVTAPLADVHYSSSQLGTGITQLEIWSGTRNDGVFPARAQPDPVVALHATTDEVWAFGTNTVQVFVPFFDQGNTAAYTPARTRSRGVAAPYSIIHDDEAFYWLDSRRRFVMGGGRSEQEVSQPLARTIGQFATVTDAWGALIDEDDWECLLWKFPTDGRCLVFNKAGSWSQWSSWDGTNWSGFPALSHHYRRDTQENLFGLEDGRVVKLSGDAIDDLGQPIRALMRTGFIDRKTQSRKACRRVSFSMKRGHATISEPLARLRYRDDEGSWRDWIPVSLGAPGDRNIRIELTSLGVYTRRQWEFEYSGVADLVIASIEEEYEVLST